MLHSVANDDGRPVFECPEGRLDFWLHPTRPCLRLLSKFNRLQVLGNERVHDPSVVGWRGLRRKSGKSVSQLLNYSQRSVQWKKCGFFFEFGPKMDFDLLAILEIHLTWNWRKIIILKKPWKCNNQDFHYLNRYFKMKREIQPCCRSPRHLTLEWQDLLLSQQIFWRPESRCLWWQAIPPNYRQPKRQFVIFTFVR